MRKLKQFFLLLIFIVSSSSVWAQIKSGPIITVSNSWMKKMDIDTYSYGTQYGKKDGKWKSQISFQLGYQFLFPFQNNFAISTAFLYQSRGIHVAFDRSFDDKVNESERMNALSINGIFNYNIIGKIPIGIGIEPTYYLNTAIADNLQKKSVFDAPLILKAGYDFGSVEVSLSYKHGFSSLYWDSFCHKTASRDIQFSIFVPLFH